MLKKASSELSESEPQVWIYIKLGSHMEVLKLELM